MQALALIMTWFKKHTNYYFEGEKDRLEDWKCNGRILNLNDIWMHNCLPSSVNQNLLKLILLFKNSNGNHIADLEKYDDKSVKTPTIWVGA